MPGSKYSKDLEFTKKDDIKEDLSKGGAKSKSGFIDTIKNAITKAVTTVKNLFSSKSKEDKTPVAQETKGLVVFGEHRYFGVSYPFPPEVAFTPDHNIYLTVE